MRCAESRTSQHRNGRLRDHGHVDADRIALAHAEALEEVGALAHLGQQLRVADPAHVRRVVALEQQGRLVAATRVHVAVHAVVGNLDQK